MGGVGKTAMALKEEKSRMRSYLVVTNGAPLICFIYYTYRIIFPNRLVAYLQIRSIHNKFSMQTRMPTRHEHENPLTLSPTDAMRMRDAVSITMYIMEV